MRLRVSNAENYESRRVLLAEVFGNCTRIRIRGTIFVSPLGLSLKAAGCEAYSEGFCDMKQRLKTPNPYVRKPLSPKTLNPKKA